MRLEEFVIHVHCLHVLAISDLSRPKNGLWVTDFPRKEHCCVEERGGDYLCVSMLRRGGKRNKGNDKITPEKGIALITQLRMSEPIKFMSPDLSMLYETFPLYLSFQQYL